MEIKTIDKIPSGSGIIGAREIQKGIANGSVNHIIIASNCPDWLINKITADGKASTTKIEKFSGNERELGTLLGKSFAIAMAGFKE